MDDEFTAALNEEFGLTPESTDTAVAEPAAAASESDKGEIAEKSTAVDGEQVPDAKEEKPAADEPANPQGDETKKDDEKLEEPKYATKDDIKEAMREYNQETTGRVDKIHEARQAIIEKVHPEGIDRNIYDDQGNIVKTAQDIVDRGLVKENGDPFTYEEAASFMLDAQRRMNESIEQLEHWAEDVAEQNISLNESNTRVMQEWGDVLQAMPTLAKQLADTYVSTQLEFDKTNSYITKMNMSPETFYSLTLTPYKQLADAMAAKEAAEAQVRQHEEVADQSERSGFPQRGESKVASSTGDPMLDALIDEMNKG